MRNTHAKNKQSRNKQKETRIQMRAWIFLLSTYNTVGLSDIIKKRIENDASPTTSGRPWLDNPQRGGNSPFLFPPDRPLIGAPPPRAQLLKKPGAAGERRGLSPAAPGTKKKYGGEGGIRTPGRVAPPLVFKTSALNRALPPLRGNPALFLVKSGKMVVETRQRIVKME